MLEALCSGFHPWWVWVGFFCMILFFIWLDMAVFHKKAHNVGVKEALMWTGIWFSLAMAFNAVLWYSCGAVEGMQFFTGYIIEKSLSVDNLFLILMVFTSFSIAPKYQHRVLFWGILGALVMRGVLIAAGAALITRFEWIFYLFGGFLVFTGVKMFFETETKFDKETNVFVRWIRKVIHVARRDSYGERFFVKEDGKKSVTVLFLALLVVEFTDLIFAFDSIPAIFAITADPFIVITSNVFAILGLRSLYFVIARAHELFLHLKTGLAIILVFIGAKLLAKDYYHIPIAISLGVVLGILLLSIVASVLFPKSEEHDA